MQTSNTTVTLEKIVALCKRRGFVYPSADIYGGLNGVYDFGHLGTLLKENIRSAWKHSITSHQNTIYFLEGALLGPQSMWIASGHVDHFNDPMVDCMHCKVRYRADEIDVTTSCPRCGNKAWTDIRQFNMMFKTHAGPVEQAASIAYLRPETAQTIFVNVKNILTSNRVKIPFGIAQIGKAFRNEITPKHFLFRMREFEQMELEWLCKPDQADEFFDYWLHVRHAFYTTIGINKNNIRLREHTQDELAHYAVKSTDIEYQFPFGWKELEGIAHRGDFDLKQHSTHSGKDLSVYDEQTKQSYIPYVIESSVGVDRLFITLLFDAYHEEQIENDQRVVLKLHPSIAPIKAAFLPLTTKLTEPMHTIYQQISRTSLQVEFDASGSIGKRYRRQDEIGTPVCFTYDFESEQDHCVTARNRDTLQQERININTIYEYITNKIARK